jgi:hypothetical protein
MEEQYSLEKTAEHLKQYAEAKADLFFLKTSEKIVSSASSITSILVVTLLSLFLLLFLSIGAAIWITEQYVSSSVGFFIIAGFYLLLVTVAILFREKLIKIPVVKILLKKLFK